MKLNFVEDVRNTFRMKYDWGDYVEDKTGVKMLEIRGSSFIADEPVIFGTLNEKYIEKELNWYKSKSLSIYDIEEPIPEIWKQVADKNGFINSNYGWCIWSEENGYQYNNVLIELMQHKYSRRAEMIYTRPSMWEDYDRDGRSDFMCTEAVQYMIRNDELHAVVKMRSNDIIFGYRNDFAWQDYVLNQLLNDMNSYYEEHNETKLKKGKIFWCAGSLHIYERHFNLIT